MANTINKVGNTVQISAIDSDWSWSDTFSGSEFAGGIPIYSIQFSPAAANDKCSIKEGSDSGPECFYAKCTADTDQRLVYYNGKSKQLVLDFSAGTFTAGSSVIIQLASGLVGK